MDAEKLELLTEPEREQWERVKMADVPLCDGYEHELKCALETVATLRQALNVFVVATNFALNADEPYCHPEIRKRLHGAAKTTEGLFKSQLAQPRWPTTEDNMWNLVASIRATYKDRDGDSVFRLNQGQAQDVIREAIHKATAALQARLDVSERKYAQVRAQKLRDAAETVLDKAAKFRSFTDRSYGQAWSEWLRIRADAIERAASTVKEG